MDTGAKIKNDKELKRSADLDYLLQQVDMLAEFGRALADANRLRILLTVARGRKSVTKVVEDVSLSQPLVSHHLRELRRAGLVKVEREGPFVYYQPAGPEVLASLSILSTLIDNEIKRG